MPKKVIPLDNTQIKQAKPKPKEYNLSDGYGLNLRIKPNRSKLWLFNYYRPYTKKRANIGLGAYPDVTLAEARELRANARNLLTKNIDPKDHRINEAKKQKDILLSTFESVATDWYATKAKKVTSETGQRIWNSIQNHLMYDLGKCPISKITAPQVIEVLKPVRDKDSLELVRRLCSRTNEIMNFAVNVGVLARNPLTKIKEAFEAPTTTHQPTLGADELPELMKALNYASIKIVTRCLIEWQLHTLVRSSEAAKAEWSEINLADKVWVIPAEKMKGTKGKKRQHTVPLSDQAVYLLERIKPISGHRRYVFPANNKPQNHANTETANMALKRMGFKNRLVSHGMRSLGSTILNESKLFDRDLIETALAHVDKNTIRKTYNNAEYIEHRRVMMNWWSERIEQAQSSKISNSARRLKVL